MSATNFPAIRRLLVIAKNESGVCSATDAGYQAQEAIPEIESILALNEELLEALEAAKKEMLELNEPCDHSVGVCWCEYHLALDKIISAIDKARN